MSLSVTINPLSHELCMYGDASARSVVLCSPIALFNQSSTALAILCPDIFPSRSILFLLSLSPAERHGRCCSPSVCPSKASPRFSPPVLAMGECAYAPLSRSSSNVPLYSPTKARKGTMTHVSPLYILVQNDLRLTVISRHLELYLQPSNPRLAACFHGPRSG